jgi:sugar phosphate isomerase/epimerase
MKVGFQTISWGRRLEDQGKEMLYAIREAGYEGVELMQHPKEFGSADKLYSYLRETNLKLLGMTGGSLSERADFIRDLIDIENHDSIYRDNAKVIKFDSDYPFIYIDTWDERQINSLDPSIILALHPHMFKPVQTSQEAEKLLKEYSHLRFIPDTAHLTVAGEDVIKVLDNNFDRIVAIHLKDWTSEFGRSYQFYSRGFGVQFGYGDVNLSKIIKFLKTKNYDRWLIVEQDIADVPREAVKHCRNWLRRIHGI